MAIKNLLTTAFLLSALAACDSGGDSATVATKTSADKMSDSSLMQRSPGKPSAPVTIDYTVLGTPLIGQPLAIEVRVASPQADQSLRLSYFINETESMMFAESQPESINVDIASDQDSAARQVRVVPLREGRLYLNVTVELKTEGGTMLKSTAIPIAVGNNPVTPTLNGELKETADGESVISMPAGEN